MAWVSAAAIPPSPEKTLPRPAPLSLPSVPGRNVGSVKIGRNDPCPCGSGAKVKRCCGVEGVRKSHEAMQDLFGLASNFPRQRPASATFDAWAERAPDELTHQVLEEGLNELGAEERARIPAEFAEAHPRMWEAILDEARDYDDAIFAVLVGAVAAGLEERRRRLVPTALEVLEDLDEVDRDAVLSLALVLAPTDLWSVVELDAAEAAVEAGAKPAVAAERIWSEWHEERLQTLVGRVREQLPVAGLPVGSSVVAAACSAFEDDDALPARLRTALLVAALASAWDILGLAA